jgi:putative FmdB family regulatory protein
MPIYAYRCDACGFAKDVLQKMSDAQLTECPSCGKSTFKKQVTAAGFQLKGSGWYVTDFRGGNSGKPAPGASADGGAKSADASTASPDSGAAAGTSTPATTTASSATTDKSGTSGGSTPSAT